MDDSDFKILLLSFVAFITASMVLTFSKVQFIKKDLLTEFNKGQKIKCYLDEDKRSFIYIDNSNFYYKKYEFISEDGSIHLSTFKCYKG